MMKLRCVLIFCLVAAMIISCSVNVFADIDTVTSEIETIITVDFGSEYADKNVSLQIYKPGKSADDITSDDELLNVIDYVSSEKTDSEGKVQIIYSPKTKAGWYTIRAKAFGMRDTLEDRFFFITAEGVKECLKTINSPDADKSSVSSLFDEPLEGMASGCVILGLDATSAYKDIFVDDKICDDDIKNVIYDLILKNAASMTDKQSAQKVFEDCVYRGVLFGLNDTQKITSYIEDYADKLGIGSEVYKNIYKSKTYCKTDAKTKIAQKISDYTWTNETPEQISDVFDGIVFATAVSKSNISINTQIDTLINLADDLLKKSGAKVDEYFELETPSAVYSQIPDEYNNILDFVSRFNTLVTEQVEKEDNKSGGGTSSSGSSKGSSGSKVSFGSGATSIDVTPPIVPEKEPAFSDISDVSWAVESINYLADKNIINGKLDGKYVPNDNMTREEFVKVLVLAFNMYNENAEVSFSDVDSNSWYYKYVASAVEKGLIYGYGNAFGSGNNITREDAVVIIHRALMKNSTELEKTRETIDFEDKSEIAEYALQSVSELYDLGVVNGVSSTSFAPKMLVTRAQAAKLIYESIMLLN